MRMLVVEDEAPAVRRMREEIGAFDLPVEIVHVEAREEACEALASTDFDFVICNLHLPARQGEEPLLQHGIAVYEWAVTQQPGTPTMLLTGSGDERAARELIAARPPADIFGVGQPYPMCDLVYKHETDAYVRRIGEVALQVEALKAIEIVAKDDARLDPGQSRVLRIFARRHHAKRVEIVGLGGLSRSTAMRATLIDGEGTDIAAVFAKIGPLSEVSDEAGRYRTAALRLPAGSYAPLLDTVDAGAGRTGGLFYGLAERHPETLFDWVDARPDEAADVVADLRRALSAWREADVRPERTLVTALRRSRISSERLESHVHELGEDWREFEAQTIVVARALRHGDLHGGNVLVGEGAIPLLIDFAGVDVGPRSFDPLVLELSLVFHPQSPFLDGPWPTLSQCARWDELDVYLVGCPASEFVTACRGWALEEALDPAAIYAVAYAEALRQLQYVPEQGERALAIASAAARRGLELCADAGRVLPEIPQAH